MIDDIVDDAHRREVARRVLATSLFESTPKERERMRLQLIRAFNDSEWTVYLSNLEAGRTDTEAIAAAYADAPTVLDIGDRCVLCGLSTAPGSGRWVDRIGADSVWETDAGAYVHVDGWMCAGCQDGDGEGDE